MGQTSRESLLENAIPLSRNLDVLGLTQRDLKLLRDQGAVKRLVIGPYEGGEWALFVTTSTGIAVLRTIDRRTRYFQHLNTLIEFVRKDFPEITRVPVCLTEADALEARTDGTGNDTPRTPDIAS